jgi:hypothetical protein
VTKKSVNRFADCDVLVIGGTLHGITVALSSAREGRNTALVMDTTSPAVEIGSSMGAWLTTREIELLPADLRDALLLGADEAISVAGEGFHLLDQRRAVTAAEDLLLDSGISLFFDAHSLGLMSRGAPGPNQMAAGALFGGKFGVAAATASVTVECSVDARLARASGHGGWVESEDVDEHAAYFLTDTENWHEALRFSEGVTLSQHGPLAEFRFRTDSPELFIRRAIIRGMAGWNRSHPDKRFTIERCGDVVLTRPARKLESDGLAGPAQTGILRFFCAGPAADTTTLNPDYLEMRTRYLPAVAEQMASILSGADNGEEKGDLTLLQPSDFAGVDRRPIERFVDPAIVSFEDPSFDEPCVDRITIDVPHVPVVRGTDLAIVGGGTSGAQSAYQAGDLGLRSVCVEKHSDVGGVSTIGGVPAYWFGRRTPFFKRLHARIKSVVRTKEIPVALALFDMIDGAGSEIIVRTPTVGVATRDGTISHVLCATRNGLAAIGARVFIDGSGDGDIAAWAGAPYSYGSERDEITMWCSFGSFHRGRDEGSRQYMSVVDQRSIHDSSRGIVSGRRMPGISRFGRYIQYYLATRESRHIHGRSTVTYLDVMMGRAFPDAVLHCKSNIDIKGLASSRAALCGYIETSFAQNHQASVPFGALTPPSISNLLVVGKAYSISHDGLSMARMQPDMMSLGAVAAHASRLALCEGAERKIARISMAELQGVLMQHGILLPGDLPHGELDERIPPDDESLVELIERLSNKPVEPAEWARILGRGESARSMLDRRDIIASAGVLLQLDRLGAVLGDRRGNDRLLEKLDSMLANDALPDSGLIGHRHEMPDHGFAPEPVYLINALAWTRDPRLGRRLARVADLLDLDPTVSDYRFSYVHGVAYGAELLGTEDAGLVAEELMSRPAIYHQLHTRTMEAGGYISERYAYLGLCLARAAARCGLVAGYRRLADYTQDVRLYLARSARAELTVLLETDHRFDADGWADEISRRQRVGELAVKPMMTVFS